jgi:hypothetical protein
MIINMTDRRMSEAAKRLKKLLRDMGYETTKHTQCLELMAKLCGFQNWQAYCIRDLASLSLLDEDLPEQAFLARDAFQMKVLEDAGFGAVARELLDRVNPTGSWTRRVEDSHSPA